MIQEKHNLNDRYLPFGFKKDNIAQGNQKSEIYNSNNKV